MADIPERFKSWPVISVHDVSESRSDTGFPTKRASLVVLAANEASFTPEKLAGCVAVFELKNFSSQKSLQGFKPWEQATGEEFPKGTKLSLWNIHTDDVSVPSGDFALSVEFESLDNAKRLFSERRASLANVGYPDLKHAIDDTRIMLEGMALKSARAIAAHAAQYLGCGFSTTPLSCNLINTFNASGDRAVYYENCSEPKMCDGIIMNSPVEKSYCRTTTSYEAKAHKIFASHENTVVSLVPVHRRFIEQRTNLPSIDSTPQFEHLTPSPESRKSVIMTPVSHYFAP